MLKTVAAFDRIGEENAFAVLARVVYLVLGPDSVALIPLYVLALFSMLVGNLGAIRQRNLKRLLAYSSIAQAGYIVIALAGAHAGGLSAMLFYLAAYAFTNLGAFGVIALLGDGDEAYADLDAFRGLFLRRPWAAAAMAATEPLEDGERGVVVNTASIAAYDGQIGQLAYSASKGGIVALSKVLAMEYGRHGIRVNTMAPGGTEISDRVVSRHQQFSLGIQDRCSSRADRRAEGRRSGAQLAHERREGVRPRPRDRQGRLAVWRHAGRRPLFEDPRLVPAAAERQYAHCQFQRRCDSGSHAE